MSVVIVGAGQAGVQVADTLRAEGYEREITLISGESCQPYQRPPLSKDFMVPGHEAAALPLRGGDYFEQRQISLLSGAWVDGLDRGARTIRVGGRELGYEHLVLATGQVARSLDVPGVELPGVHTLRTLQDATALHSRLEAARSVVVVGSGYIGLEFASAARAHGCEVHVLSPSAPLRRSVSGMMSKWVGDAHAGAGTMLHPAESVASFEAGTDGSVATVFTTGGLRLAADLVVIGVGATPVVDLASRAGLGVGDGIEVDAALRTTDPRIMAIGDCASFPNVFTGTRTRLESVQNATDQGRHAARSILASDAGAQAAPYEELPWFWSVQGKNRIQLAGLAACHDDALLLGDQESGKFSIARFNNGALCAVESVNCAADHLAARTLLSARVRLSPEVVMEPGFTLKAAAQAHKSAALAA